MQKKRIGVIANFPNEITPRANLFFTSVFESYKDSLQWEYITYKDLLQKERFDYALQMDGLILSSSNFVISDPLVQRKMQVEIYLVNEYKGPIFGMCFGHHLMELTFGAEITEQIATDFLSDQNIPSLEVKSDQKPKEEIIENSPVHPTEQEHIKNSEYIPLFDDVFGIFTPEPAVPIFAFQHRTHPIFGIDFNMQNNPPEIAFGVAVSILGKFLAHFYKK